MLTVATLRCSLCRLLNNPTWIPHLVQGLMLEPSHPRNLQDSPLPPTDPATKARIQCDYAECLAQVSLFGPGRVALLRDAGAMKSLEQLSTEGMTAEAQQHASTALLALLEASLEAMRMSALQKRAKAAGISDDQVDDAMESKQPKKALIALLLSQ